MALSLCAYLALLGCAGTDGEAPPTTPSLEELEAAITAEELRTDIAALSSDEMGGRGPGSEGDRMARQYMIEQMQAIGLEPGGPNGSWEQPFEIVGVTSEVPETWTFTGAGGSLALKDFEQFIAGSGVQAEKATVEDAELVYVGYGIVAPEYQWDDFDGVDLSGKMLVVLNNDPDWSDDLFEGTRRLYYGRWSYKYETSAAQGAAGAIIIHTTPSAGYPFQVVQTSWTGEQFQLPAGDEPRNQIEAWVTEDAAKQLFELAGLDYDAQMEAARSADFTPVPMGVRTSLTLDNTVTRKETANVLGVLPGTDPQLSDEYVVYTAHHDHLGNAGEGEDPIYNGALDNASGVAQVLAIARQLKRAPTRRSNLFNFVAAEEQGLLGSEFYARNPTVAPGKMAANLNFDGGNIWGKTRDVTYIGLGKSSLDEVVRAGAARQGREVLPDQFPDKGFFYRSDQFNFAKIGVPAIYLDTGTDFIDREPGWGKQQIDQWTEVHYHQVSDELLDDWNFDGMIDDVALGLYCGITIGNADEMPRWNEGDEFERARLDALATVAE